MTRGVALIAAVLGTTAAPALALCPHPVPKACSAFFTSDAVFVGTVLSKQYVDDYETIRFVVRVSRTLRGSVHRTRTIYTGNDSGRVNWDVGRKYVVFAQRVNGRLESEDDCGPLSDPTRVSQTVREVEALRSSRATAIEGAVLTTPDDTGVPGVIIRVHGSRRDHEAVSDAHGRFRMELPPGRYRLDVDPKVARPSYFYSFADPGDIRLEMGQCAQIELITK